VSAGVPAKLSAGGGRSHAVGSDVVARGGATVVGTLIPSSVPRVIQRYYMQVVQAPIAAEIVHRRHSILEVALHHAWLR
jgi:hypothetical protein